MKLETTKGEYNGNAVECVEWLEDHQPSHASVVIGCHSATIDAMPGEWERGLRVAVVEITKDADVEGGEEEWQQYLSVDQLADLVENE